ncbi:uncharacterized protein LTR77_009834 [Saxophila tyrrhenica]|uniref:Alpha/beta hydrolase fold-3 domain-containing protein n=1 Tax=Saxophila tyrrhenica TaxID=1690608 RepID=A0AAV9P1G5_9PEZI|nr:hypothetical protein LTR77_009834 [Saxophila tyrrhenica]
MLLSQEELEKAPYLHQDIADFLANAPAPEHPPDPDQELHLTVRQTLNAQSAAIIKKLGDPPEGTAEFYQEIPVRDGFSSSLKIHKPSNGGGPLVVLAFGGGFLGGDNDQLSEVARGLVKLYGATVVNISYRVGPENKFPYAVWDAWDSLIWITDNASGEELAADPSKGFIMGGVSAGGALTAVLSRKFQGAPLKHGLTGQWLCIPAIMESNQAPEKYRSYHISREQNSNNPTLPTASIKVMFELSKIDIDSDLAFAINSKTPMSEQPKSYFQVAGMDPIRDDGLIYEEMLKDAGVATKLDFYPGCVHGHQMLVESIDLGKKANIDTMVGFGWLLGKEVSREEAANAYGVNVV